MSDDRSTAFNPPTAAEAEAAVAAAQAERDDPNSTKNPGSAVPTSLTMSSMASGGGTMGAAGAATDGKSKSLTPEEEVRMMMARGGNSGSINIRREGDGALKAGTMKDDMENENDKEDDEEEEMEWEELAGNETVFLPGKELVKRMGNVSFEMLILHLVLCSKRCFEEAEEGD